MFLAALSLGLLFLLSANGNNDEVKLVPMDHPFAVCFVPFWRFAILEELPASYKGELHFVSKALIEELHASKNKHRDGIHHELDFHLKGITASGELPAPDFDSPLGTGLPYVLSGTSEHHFVQTSISSFPHFSGKLSVCKPDQHHEDRSSSYLWSHHRTAMNRKQHAMNGNPFEGKSIVISKQIHYVIVPASEPLTQPYNLKLFPLVAEQQSETQPFSTGCDMHIPEVVQQQLKCLSRSLKRSRAEAVSLKQELKRIRIHLSLSQKERSTLPKQHAKTPKKPKTICKGDNFTCDATTRDDDDSPFFDCISDPCNSSDHEMQPCFSDGGPEPHNPDGERNITTEQSNDALDRLTSKFERMLDEIPVMQMQASDAKWNRVDTQIAQLIQVDSAQAAQFDSIFKVAYQHGAQIASLVEILMNLTSAYDKQHEQNKDVLDRLTSIFERVSNLECHRDQVEEFSASFGHEETNNLYAESQNSDEVGCKHPTEHDERTQAPPCTACFSIAVDEHPNASEPGYIFNTPSTGTPKPYWRQRVSEWNFEPLSQLSFETKRQDCVFQREFSLRAQDAEFQLNRPIQGKIVDIQIYEPTESSIYTVCFGNGIQRLIHERVFFYELLYKPT